MPPLTSQEETVIPAQQKANTPTERLRTLLSELRQELLSGAKEPCACIYSPGEYDTAKADNPSIPVILLPGRCRYEATGEDGLCEECRSQEHGIERFPDARHAFLGIPMSIMWGRLPKRKKH